MRSSTGRFWGVKSAGESDDCGQGGTYVEFFREMALSGWPSRWRRLPSKSRELSSRIRPSRRLEWIRDAQLTFDRVETSGVDLQLFVSLRADIVVPEPKFQVRPLHFLKLNHHHFLLSHARSSWSWWHGVGLSSGSLRGKGRRTGTRQLVDAGKSPTAESLRRGIGKGNVWEEGVFDENWWTESEMFESLKKSRESV